MQQDPSIKKKLIWSLFYGIGMALLEAVVVVYLRKLYYPDGFSFPLKSMDWNIYQIEVLREAGTMVMLICVSALAAVNFHTWFAFFLFNFGVWDIFYYVWLKVLLNWPAHLMEWDILFLIPITWDGPVICPLLCSLAMIVLACIILTYHKRGLQVRLKYYEWFLLLGGALLVFTSFIWNYTNFLIDGGYFNQINTLSSNTAFWHAMEQFQPPSFQWGYFLVGFGIILVAIGLLARRLRKEFKTLQA